MTEHHVTQVIFRFAPTQYKLTKTLRVLRFQTTSSWGCERNNRNQFEKVRVYVSYSMLVHIFEPWPNAVKVLNDDRIRHPIAHHFLELFLTINRPDTWSVEKIADDHVHSNEMLWWFVCAHDTKVYTTNNTSRDCRAF